MLLLPEIVDTICPISSLSNVVHILSAHRFVSAVGRGLVQAACSAVLFVSVSSAQVYDETIYVGPTTGSRETAAIGSKANPYQTIDEAVQYAVYVNKRNERHTQILVAPGTYRESINLITYTNFDTNQPLNESLITIEAEIPTERPIVSGSDVWTEWQISGSTFAHHWPFDWGLTDVRFGNNELADIVKRREMIFVNGDRLTPVDTVTALVAGSFYVDEEIDSVFVFPSNGIDLTTSLVEVAVRPTTWAQEFENNVTIRGLVFQHSNDEWLDGSASIKISSSHGLTIEDCDFRDNNWTGLYIGRSDNVTVRNSRMNDNGGRGLAVWNLRHGRFENSETSGNNWRGFLGNFAGWTVGNNIDSSHDIVFFRHTANNNFARGLWFDTDVKDALVFESTFYNNRNDGLFIEATQGPIAVMHSYVVENGRDGLFTGAVEQLTLEHNFFRDNFRSAIRVSGAIGGREITDFETDSVQIVETRNWTILNNRFVGSGPFMLGTTVDQTTWDDFTSTLTSDFNDWCHPAQGAIFQTVGGSLQTLSQWRLETGQDLNSTYCNPALANEPENTEGVELTIELFPNPLVQSGQIVVKTEHATDHVIQIYDALGRRLKREAWPSATTTTVSIDASSLSAGVYFVIVEAGLNVERREFIVAR